MLAHISLRDLMAEARRRRGPDRVPRRRRVFSKRTRAERTPTEPTPRQERIAVLVAAGMILKQIAVALGLSEATVKADLVNIGKRLRFSPDLSRHAQLVRWWIEHREITDSRKSPDTPAERPVA
jgi:DNA-binding NarL/FixJ family response regulator